MYNDGTTTKNSAVKPIRKRQGMISKDTALSYIDNLIATIEGVDVDGFVRGNGEVVRVEDLGGGAWHLAMVEEILLQGFYNMSFYSGGALYQFDTYRNYLVEVE